MFGCLVSKFPIDINSLLRLHDHYYTMESIPTYG